MRNMVKTAVVGAIAAAFVASVAVADGQGPGQRRKPGMHGPGGPGGPRLGAIMRDLTDEQRTQIRAIVEQQRAGQDGPPADMKLRRELEAELLADVPNDGRIEELRQQILAAQTDALNRHIAVQKQVVQVLTPEQRATARERLAKEPAGRRGRGEVR